MEKQNKKQLESEKLSLYLYKFFSTQLLRLLYFELLYDNLKKILFLKKSACITFIFSLQLYRMVNNKSGIVPLWYICPTLGTTDIDKNNAIKKVHQYETNLTIVQMHVNQASSAFISF